MAEVVHLPELVSEVDAYARFPILEDKELRRARQAKAIGYFRRKHSIFYRLDELERFVARKLDESYVPPCPTTHSSASGDTGSPPSPDQGTSTVSGMTPDLEKSAAEALAREILSKPRSASPSTFS